MAIGGSSRHGPDVADETWQAPLRVAHRGASPYDVGHFPLPRRMPTLHVRHFSSVHAAVLAALAALITTGCAHSPESPAAPVAEPAQAAPASTRGSDGPTTVATVLAVYRTQQVERDARERCGEQIATPPEKSLWSRMFSSTPSADSNIPPPVFEPEIACDQVAMQRYQTAHYRVVYRFQSEDYSVDLDYDPGVAVRLDDTGRVLGPAPRP